MIMSEEHLEQLARIDERTKNIQAEVELIRTQLTNHYVSKSEFAPVKAIVYTMVGLVMTTVVGAVVALVVT